MKRKRRTKPEILELLKAAASSQDSVRAFCKMRGISEQNFYRWKRQYDHDLPTEILEPSIAATGSGRERRDEAAENVRLRLMIANLYVEREELRAKLQKRRSA